MCQVTFATHDARFVVLELEGLQPGMQDFRIRDVVLVENGVQDVQPVTVLTGNERAMCPSTQCQFSFSESPAITSIQPSSGQAGAQLTVQGSGFDAGNCHANEVLVGARRCELVSCTADTITCSVPEQAAGTYDVSMRIAGVGRVAVPSSISSFRQTLVVTSVGPSAIGFGGGLVLTFTGSGFGMDKAEVDVKICNRPCDVISTNSSSFECLSRAVADVPSAPGSNTRSMQVASEHDDAVEDANGIIVVDGNTIGAEWPQLTLPSIERYKERAQNWYGNGRNRKTVYFRFTGLDIPQGARVTEAQVHVRAARPCPRGTIFQMWAEDSDSSAGFDPALPGSLASRPRTNVSVDWQLQLAWKWMAEEHESVDISPLLNAVFSRPGWSSKSSLTIMMKQAAPFTDVCQMLSADYKREYGPKLRLVLNSTSITAAQPALNKSCTISVGVKGPWGTFVDTPACPRESLMLTSVTKGEKTGKQAYEKPSGSVLTFSDAYELCAAHGARLCSTEEIFDTPAYMGGMKPFFGFKPAGSYVPINLPRSEIGSAAVEAPVENIWIPVSEKLPVDNAVRFLSDDGCTEESPCTACHGDCDKDSDCASGMFCFQRDYSSRQYTPGCPTAGHRNDIDHCSNAQIDPYWGRAVFNRARGCGGGSSQCPVSASSITGWGGPASSVVDGLTNTFFHTECNRANEWFRLDLESEHKIGSVRIYNRPNWPEGLDRFRGAEIRVGNVNSFDGNPVCASNLPGDAVITVTCGAAGRYVFVVQPRSDTCLHFAEIEVYPVGALGWTGAQDNTAKVALTPCCGGPGHPGYMAVDGMLDTYWLSKEAAGAVLEIEILTGAHSVRDVQIEWTEDYASEYTINLSLDQDDYVEVLRVMDGDGQTDQLTVPNRELTDSRWRFMRVIMHVPALGRSRFGVREITVYGSGSTTTSCSSAAFSKVSRDDLMTVQTSLTPVITAVEPLRGSTAGGTDVTITGSFPVSDASLLNVAIGVFPCLVKSAETVGNLVRITCVSGASGVKHGGRKHVTVTAQGHGSSPPVDTAMFWYIDTWSARTTWGGSAPPTGCGSWVDDKDCTDSVVIPEGQVILLDISLPRFYLILIEGTLVFDRKDIELSASYILLRGGTLEIGTELEPFMQQAKITMYGHPKSVELPTFGAKVIACYKCTMDIHGAPQQSWTLLSETAHPGASEIKVMDAVTWPVGAKIVIATTDFESPSSSHTEVATIASVSQDGKTLGLTDIRVCHTYSNNGLPLICDERSTLKYPHLGAAKTFDGRELEFRAEVGLLSRNIIIEGDHDQTLCPLAELADDGVTRLSCNQFGAQLFFHSPGHESLIARIANFELRNAGQAFRLGRYAIHWHMVGNLRESFQRNVSVHHSWNRGTAVHGVHYLRLMGNVVYHIMGHTFFIEDGIEEYNVLDSNVAIKTIPSMNLLNTDQTPAGFWIVSGKNRILNNRAAASRRYGIWFRPEISATGTSVNTPMEVYPWNIPILEFDGNHAHSNGKYGLRVFDIYQPNAPSVFRNTFVWRNAKVGWTATVIGRVGFDGIVAVQNGHHVFESRSTSQIDNWDQAYIKNGFFVDYTGLPLADSYGEFGDAFGNPELLGGPMKGGILLPWNEDAGGGFSVHNTTFVNFKNGCIRGCAHCGRGGSPVLGDGAFETRFSGMRFVNSSQRVLFRHPNEAFFYDLDGTLTGTGIVEDYTKGGNIRGSSFVGTSTHLPSNKCQESEYTAVGVLGRRLLGEESTPATGGSVCRGLIFRRSWFHIDEPTPWVGKALCVRMPWQSEINTCQSLKPECNCLPYLKKAWKGIVMLVAEGYRYNLQMDLLPHEMADPARWRHQIWDSGAKESFYFTKRFLQWDVSDSFGRPLFWMQHSSNNAPQVAQNFIYNTSLCSYVGCGQVVPKSWPNQYSDDTENKEGKGWEKWFNGSGVPRSIPLPVTSAGPYCSSDCWRGWTILPDLDENGALFTYVIHGAQSWQTSSHRVVNQRPKVCPMLPVNDGCWPKPPPPPAPPPEADFSPWSKASTWANLTTHKANPLNEVDVHLDKKAYTFNLRSSETWSGPIPSEFDNVWIPSWVSN